MVETEQMGIVPEFNNNMRTKNFLRATLLAATLVVAGYGGMKAYDYSYAKRVNSDDNMLMANVEALSEDGEGGGEVVKCYCKKNIWAPNICSVLGSLGYCGPDPCSNHDGNCR